jgi:hypothetical protein
MGITFASNSREKKEEKEIKKPPFPVKEKGVFY